MTVLILGVAIGMFFICFHATPDWRIRLRTEVKPDAERSPFAGDTTVFFRYLTAMFELLFHVDMSV